MAGVSGFVVPVYFLDADLPENSDWDRTLTHFLYGGDERYRLCQEIILGIGGVRMLRALGCDAIERFHMNEGHASLLTIELLDELARKAGRDAITQDHVTLVRPFCNNPPLGTRTSAKLPIRTTYAAAPCASAVKNSPKTMLKMRPKRR